MDSTGSEVREVWWLVALEASLFLSFPTWELATQQAWPANSPIGFGVTVIFGAAAAMILCHVAPAYAGRWIAGLSTWRKDVVAAILTIYLGFGLGAFRMCANAGELITRVWTWPPSAFGARPESWAVASLVSVVFLCAWIVPARKALTAAACIYGFSILIAGFAIQFSGLWSRNTHFVSEADFQHLELMIPRLVLCAAPLIGIAWTIGANKLSTEQIWRTGLAGVWLPLSITCAIASLARMGGIRLHWVPSLPFSYSFALVGWNRDDLFAFKEVALTDVGYILVWGSSLVCVTRELRGVKRAVLTALVVAALAYWGPGNSDPWNPDSNEAQAFTGIAIIAAVAMWSRRPQFMRQPEG